MPGPVRVRGPSAAPIDPLRPAEEPGEVFRRFVEILARCEQSLARRTPSGRRRPPRGTAVQVSA